MLQTGTYMGLPKQNGGLEQLRDLAIIRVCVADSHHPVLVA